MQRSVFKLRYKFVIIHFKIISLNQGSREAGMNDNFAISYVWSDVCTVWVFENL
jgi:hypothetical protein